MKILMVDKYFFIKGGAERYFFELSKLLEKKGHEIIPFSMKHERNFQTEFSDYFVDNIEFNHTSKINKLINSPKIFGRIIYSTHAQKQIAKIIEKTTPDIAHLHMIDHQISPSIIPVLKKYSIPIIQTVHQYKLVCPNYRLYIEHKNEICERCIKGDFYHAALQQCHKHSFASSMLLSLEMYIHKWLKIYDQIDLFHTPSTFMKEKLIAGGVKPEKVRNLFYTLNISDYPYHPEFENYFIYFGRLSGEKGILTLLKAAAKLNIKSTRLLIVGEGPEKDKLMAFAASNNLSQVEFVGAKYGDELKSIVANSKFIVVPSEWYDNSPLVIYEAFCLGKPVIGSNLGGIPELVDDNVNGLVHSPGDEYELAAKIDALLSDDRLINKYGAAARKKAERQFAPDYHYQEIQALYKLISKQAD